MARSTSTTKTLEAPCYHQPTLKEEELLGVEYAVSQSTAFFFKALLTRKKVRVVFRHLYKCAWPLFSHKLYRYEN